MSPSLKKIMIVLLSSFISEVPFLDKYTGVKIKGLEAKSRGMER